MDNIEDFRQYLIEWFRANEEQMIAAYDQQLKVARDNRERQLAAKASAGGDPRPASPKGQIPPKARTRARASPKASAEWQ